MVAGSEYLFFFILSNNSLHLMPCLLQRVYRSMYKRTSRMESNGRSCLHSRFFLFRPLPLPTNLQLMRTVASFHTLEPLSVSTDSSSRIPSFSFASASVSFSSPLSKYLTYMGSCLNLSRSCGICKTRSAPGEETCKQDENLL